MKLNSKKKVLTTAVVTALIAASCISVFAAGSQENTKRKSRMGTLRETKMESNVMTADKTTDPAEKKADDTKKAERKGKEKTKLTEEQKAELEKKREEKKAEREAKLAEKLAAGEITQEEYDKIISGEKPEKKEKAELTEEQKAELKKKREEKKAEREAKLAEKLAAGEITQEEYDKMISCEKKQRTGRKNKTTAETTETGEAEEA